MEGGVIPKQHPRGLADRLQTGATPLQKLGGDGAHRTSRDEAQRHLLANRISSRTLLPKHPVTSEGFGIRITLLPSLFHQAYRLLHIPAWACRRGSAKRLHHTSSRNPMPSLAVRSPKRSNGSVPFFLKYRGSGLVIQCLPRFQLI